VILFFFFSDESEGGGGLVAVPEGSIGNGLFEVKFQFYL
jgi:hypothetical protein